MKLVVFSSSDRSVSEAKEVVKMFEQGLELFHLRKSGFNQKELSAYIEAIPAIYHKRIVLHSSHQLKKAYKIGGLHVSRTHRKKKYKSAFSFWKFKLFNAGLFLTRTHSKLSTLSDDRRVYHYVFLSPMYNSISKIGHAGNFGNRSVEKFIKLSKSPVFALGGVEVDKFQECKELGFVGVAVLGSIWNHKTLSPIDAFTEAQKAIKSL